VIGGYRLLAVGDPNQCFPNRRYTAYGGKRAVRIN
jgi:hypothetical protein